MTRAPIGRSWALLALTTLAIVSIAGQSLPAAVIPFVSNVTNNSGDWTTSVSGLGGTINTNVNFNSHPAGALNGSFYSASDGVTISSTGTFNTVLFGSGPGQSNTGTGPVSSGEGVHAASNFLFGDSLASTLTISFASPVLGAGLSIIDLFNPGSQPSTRNAVSLSAFTGAGGTGTLLGTFDSAQFNFQANNVYFMGVVSTAGDIGSIVLNHPGDAGDEIGVDDVRFATGAVPEPASMALFGMGALGLFTCGYRRRRRMAEE